MPVYMSGKEDIWEKACQITTRRGLKADSHCVGIREAEEALAHIREWDFSHVDNHPAWGQGLSSGHGHRERRISAFTGPSIQQDQRCRGNPLNVELCPKVLVPLGIDFREAPGNLPLPFPGMKLKEQSKKLK